MTWPRYDYATQLILMLEQLRILSWACDIRL